MARPIRIDIDPECDHGPLAAIYATDADGQLQMVAAHHFGPFDTLYDILQWSLRHSVETVGLPLR